MHTERGSFMKLKKLFFGGGILFALTAGVFSLSMIKSLKRAAQVDATIGTMDVMVSSRTFNEGGSYYKNGDGYPFTGKSDDYNAYWNGGAQTLVLKDYNAGPVLVDSSDPVTIELVGDNIITANYGEFIGIKAGGAVTLTGSGTLQINVEKSTGVGDAIGIYSDKTYITDDVSVSIDMTKVTTGRFSRGIWSNQYVSLEDNANLQIDMDINSTLNTNCAGIYTTQGSMVFDSTGDLEINVNTTNENDQFAILNWSNSDDFDNNGDITFTGSGDVTLTRTGSGFANAIANGQTSGNNDGVISFDGCGEVNITGFAYSILNKSKERVSADYDIYIHDGAKVTIETEYDGFGKGLYSLHNGILIEDADYTYDGVGRPVDCGDSSSWGSNHSIYGFDVKGASHVDIRTDSYIYTYSSAISSMDLSGNGYFNYANRAGRRPALDGSYFILQGTNTRLCREHRFSKNTDYAPTGTYHVGGYWGYEEYPIRFEAYVIPSPEQIDLGSAGYFSNSKLYYVNGDSEMRSSVEDDAYNAYYDKDKGILYLKGYDGGAIGFTSFTSGLLRIVVEEDSVIDDVGYGIDVRGSGSIELTTKNRNERRLTIYSRQYTGSNKARGIGIGGGNLLIGGHLYVTIYATIQDDTEDAYEAPTGVAIGLDVGYSSSGNITIEDHSSIQIHCNSDYDAGVDSVAKADRAISCQGKVTIDVATHVNYHDIVLDASSVEGNSYCLFASSYNFVRYTKIQFKWHEDGVNNGIAYYGLPYLKGLENGELRINKDNKTATLEGGTTYTVDVKNSIVWLGADNNRYLDNSEIYFYGYEISGVEFVRWEKEGDVNINDTTNRSTWAAVHGDATITPVYDYMKTQPVFDTRGSSENGWIVFDFKGSPNKVFVVEETGDETNVVYDTTNVTKSTSFNTTTLPNGTYRLCAKYTAVSLDTVYFFSDTFTVDHSSSAKVWDVTYHANGGTGSNYVVSTNGSYSLATFADSGFTAPEGKRFYKWAEGDPDGTERNPGYNRTVNENLHYYALYENIPTHTLTLTAGTGATGTMDSIVRNEEQKFVLPAPTFTHGDHVSFKWTIGSTDYQPGDEIAATSDMTAYGNYTSLPTYTLDFDSGDGSGSMSDQVKYSDENFVLPECTFTAPEHKHFAYWDVGGVEKHPGDEIEATADCTAEAIYEWDVHTIAFDNNGGSGSMDSKNYSYGTILTLPACEFTAPAHKQFKCWSIGGTEYSAGASYTITGNATALAVYEDIMRTITFSAGEGSGSMANDTCVDGQEYTLPVSTFTAPTHEQFKCWRIGENEYGAGTKVTINEDTNIVAVYEDIMLNVSFLAGEGSGSMDPVAIKEGNTYVLPDCGFTAPAHKVFKCWSIGGDEYEVGANYTVESATTITAVYEDIVRTITFSAGEGSGTMANDTCVDGQEYTLPESTFAAPAHEQFKCWRIGENEYGAGTKVTINADTNIVAVYEDIMVNVSFVAGDGSGTMASVPVKEGSSYVLPECTFTAPEGKVFDGWMIGETKHAAGESVVIDSGTTVTAVFKDAPVEPVIPDTPESGAKKGLSGGAIAGIVVGSVFVAGVGGFALVWFVVLKKSGAELIAVFKKIPAFFKGLFKKK